MIVVKTIELVSYLRYYIADNNSDVQFTIAFIDALVVCTMAAKVHRKMKLGEPGLLNGVAGQIPLSTFPPASNHDYDTLQAVN